MKMRNFVVASLALFLIAGAAFGQVTLPQRNTYYTFTLPDTNTFAGANGFYDNFINLQATNLGDSIAYNWSIESLAQGFNWATGGNFSLNYSLTAPTQYTGNLQAVNGLTDTMEISYGFPVGADFSQSFITTGYAYGHYVLNFSGGGFSGVTNGNPYYLYLSIPGDWSTQGTAQGDHNFISLNSNWTINNDFVYSSGTTYFSASELNYQGDNPQLQFQLIGAPTPEPSSMVLLGTGLVGLAGAVRRKLRG